MWRFWTTVGTPWGLRLSVCNILSSPPFFEGLRLSVFLFVMFNPHHQFLIGCVCLFVMFYHHHQFNRAERRRLKARRWPSGLKRYVDLRWLFDPVLHSSFCFSLFSWHRRSLNSTPATPLYLYFKKLQNVIKRHQMLFMGYFHCCFVLTTCLYLHLKVYIIYCSCWYF